MTVLMAKEKKRQEEPAPEKAERIRLIIDTDEDILHAVEMRAIAMSVQARRRVNKSEAVNAILREALAAELQDVERHRRKRPNGA